MGRSVRKIDPLAFPPRNVWDSRGELVGIFFQATRTLRLQDGSMLAVNSSNQVEGLDGSTVSLDLTAFVISSVGFTDQEEDSADS